MTQAERGRVRFVGGHFDRPAEFDWECRLISRVPDEIRRNVPIGGVVLQTLSEPSRTIHLQSRYVGKVIGAADTDTTTTVCTYVMDGETGMATWTEDEHGNVTVTAFDYPG